MVILPEISTERILMQLACLQSKLIFCPYNPKDLTETGISERIQKLSINCIITNKDYLETVRRCTHNPLRPLKKGLITNSSNSEPVPVSWNHFIRSVNDAESEYTKTMTASSTTPVIRLLGTDHRVVEYSQENFDRLLILTA